MTDADRLATEEAARLATWVAAFSRAGIQSAGPEVVQRALAVLLDDLAAIVASAGEREVLGVAEIARRRGPVEEATLFATRARAERAWAALSNAVAANWAELDEGYRPASCHGGLYTVPAAIAEAEASGATLEAVLTAIVGGYEVATRVARGFPPPRPPVFHPHATLASIGAAGAVAAMRQLPPDATIGVLGAAATFALAGPFGHAPMGDLVRNAWAGVGAWLGFAAVDLGAAGLTARGSSIRDVFATGLGSDEPDAERVTALSDGLGEHFAVSDGYHKLYACCQYAHSAVEAAVELRKGPLRDVALDDLARLREVRVETHPLGLTLSNREPATLLAAKFSLPHVVAAVLATGEATPRTFSSELLEEPVVHAIRRVVSVAPYVPEPTPPYDRPARVTVTGPDGLAHTAEVLSSAGSPDRPLSDDDLLRKIEQLTSPTRPAFSGVAERLLSGSIDIEIPWSQVVGDLLADRA